MLTDMHNITRQLIAPAIAAFALFAAMAGSTFAASDTIWVDKYSGPINHFESWTVASYCPAGYVVGDSSNPAAVPFINTSSPGVSAALAGGGYGATYAKVSLTNWNF